MKNQKNYVNLLLVFLLSLTLLMFSACSESDEGGDFPFFLLNNALSSEKEISAFSITTTTFTIPDPALSVKFIGSINGTDITVKLPTGTDVTALVANFTINGTSITVGDTPQENGTTANDFTSDVTYTVTAEDNSTQDYIVSVNADCVVYDGDYTVIGDDLTDLSTYIGITGSLEILSPTLTELNGLDGLMFVGNGLIINGIPALTSVNISNLTTVGLVIDISMNMSITSIDLSNLTTVGDVLLIVDNDALTTMNIVNLTNIEHDMHIVDNDVLTSIDFNNITNLDGMLAIFLNNDLTSINFSKLTNVGINVDIMDNEDLTSMDFGNLTSVGGTLNFFNNDMESIDLNNLTDVSSLFINLNDNLESIYFSNLTTIANNLDIWDNEDLISMDFTNLSTVGSDIWIQNNFDLPTCAADNLVLQLVGYTGTANIGGNDDSVTCD